MHTPAGCRLGGGPASMPLLSTQNLDNGELPALDPEDMAEHAGDASRLLRALANPSRLVILCLLSEGELSVGQINSKVPLAQSALSQHLAVLRRDGLVDTRRESQTIYYSVKPGPAADILTVLHSHFCPAPI